MWIPVIVLQALLNRADFAEVIAAVDKELGWAREICEIKYVKNAVQDFCLKQNLSFWARVWHKLEKLSEKVAPTCSNNSLSCSFLTGAGWLFRMALLHCMAQHFKAIRGVDWSSDISRNIKKTATNWIYRSSCSWHDALWILWTI